MIRISTPFDAITITPQDSPGTAFGMDVECRAFSIPFRKTKGDLMNDNPDAPKIEKTKTNKDVVLTEAQLEFARMLGMVLARRWLEEQERRSMSSTEEH